MLALLGFLLCIQFTNAILGSEPITNFFDGSDNMNQCKTRLERRVVGMSGIIYSHALFGRVPYNASRNCFMMILAPIGYRIRLKVITFEVNGHISNCDKDTLHVFDHEETMDPRQPAPAALDESATPGPIIGQFCGRITNRSELSVSSHNALTLWWHSDPHLSESHQAKGFKILWTSFRKTKTAPCSTTRELACSSDECIPLELACDRHADCLDEADLDPQNQLAAKCENLDMDPITAVSGIYVLLFSGGIVLFICCACASLCICCRCGKINQPEVKASSNTTATESTVCVVQPINQSHPHPSHHPPHSQPLPPHFYPPSPPKIPPPSAASGYTPRRCPQFETGMTVHDGYRTVKINDYGYAHDQQNEYSYVTDVHLNLL